MTDPNTPTGYGPGLPRQTYLDILAAGEETGWWDEHGIPAPWPDDFIDPNSGWQPTPGGDTTTNTDPHQPF